MIVIDSCTIQLDQTHETSASYKIRQNPLLPILSQLFKSEASFKPYYLIYAYEINQINIAVFVTVPVVGVEPTLPKEHDFESCASTNSATPANNNFIIISFC